MSLIKVSVIVPVFNVAPWLPRALDSLLNQTLSDIEIICVDDASTDDSLSVLLDYQKKYPAKITIIQLPENGGAAVARNAGLGAARGEYVGFVDPDDFVDLDFYERLYAAATAADADIAKAELKTFEPNGEIKLSNRLAKIKENKAWFQGEFTTAIYRRDFLIHNKITFPVGIIVAQDIAFLTRAVFTTDQIAFAPGTFYNYIRRPGSLDSPRLSYAKVKSSIASFDNIISFINQLNLDRVSYDIACSGRLSRILSDLFYRNLSMQSQFFVVKSAIALFKKCRSPELLTSLDIDLWNFLISENETGLLLYLLKRKSKETKIELFGFFPLLTIKNKPSKIKYKLFGFIPVFVFYKQRRFDLSIHCK